jgi:hypothetical protein
LFHPVHAESCLRLNHDPASEWKDAKAFCGVHPNCTLTRTCKPGRRAGQGRPMFVLWAWLTAANLCEDKYAHSQFRPSLAERLISRAELDTNPAATDWLQAEDNTNGRIGEPDVFT